MTLAFSYKLDDGMIGHLLFRLWRTELRGERLGSLPATWKTVEMTHKLCSFAVFTRS